MRRVVILGSGFAGLHIARQLGEEFARRRGLQLTVITDRSHFLFTPMWSSVATGSARLSQIAIPLEKVLDRSVDVVIDRATTIDVDGREVIGERHRYPYDFLVIAVGTEIDWRGNPEFERYVRPCKTGRDGVDIDEAVTSALTRASRASDHTVRRRALTFTVAGAGATGVELIAKLASRLEDEFSSNERFRELAGDARLVLVEPQERVLPNFDEELQPLASEHLRAAGVELRLGEAVTGCTDTRVELSSGDAYACENVLWCAGVRPPSWLKASGFDTDIFGRVTAHRTLQAANHHNVYVAGDIAGVGSHVPMKASVAVSQADVVTRNIVADLSGRSRRDWLWEDDGALLSLGRANAAVNVRGMVLQGRPAQAVWGAVSARLLPEGLQRFAMMPSLLAGVLSSRSSSDGPRLLSD